MGIFNMPATRGRKNPSSGKVGDMPASRGIKKPSSGKVGYKISGIKEKLRRLPPGKLAYGVENAHKALGILRNYSKNYTAKINKLMRQVSKDAVNYTPADTPMLNAVATTIRNETTRFKTGMDKSMADVRGSGLNMGQTGPRNKLSLEDYAAKYKDIAIQYGCDENEFNDMTPQMQKQMILATKWANKQDEEIEVDHVLKAYKASKAPRKPKAESTAPKAPKAPKAPQTFEDLAASTWKTTAGKGEGLPPQFAGWVSQVDSRTEITPMERWYVLFQQSVEAMANSLWQDSRTKTSQKSREAALSQHTEVLRLKGLIEEAVDKVGKDASMTEVVKHVDEDTMMAIITFMRVKMGFRPKTNKSPGTEAVTVVPIHNMTQVDVDDMVMSMSANGNGKAPEDMHDQVSNTAEKGDSSGLADEMQSMGASAGLAILNQEDTADKGDGK